jgi:hypothetical protein
MRAHLATAALVAYLSPHSSAFVLPSSRLSGGGRAAVIVVAPPTAPRVVDDAVDRHDRRRRGDGRQRRGRDCDGDVIINIVNRRSVFLRSASSTEEFEISTIPSPSKSKKGKRRKLGLITFDLDDTLYPIAPVLDEANAAFSTAMSNFGYVDIRPSDIVETGKEIRANLGTTAGDDAESSSVGGSSSPVASDPLRPKTVNHKEIRMAAIRKEMEGFILRTKLKQTAADWATEVDSITSPVRKSAEK